MRTVKLNVFSPNVLNLIIMTADVVFIISGVIEIHHLLSTVILNKPDCAFVSAQKKFFTLCCMNNVSKFQIKPAQQ